MKLFTKNNCPRCMMTKMVLGQLHIHYKEVNLSQPENKKYVSVFKAHNIKSTPIVEPNDKLDNNVWTGFVPSKIRAYASHANAIA